MKNKGGKKRKRAVVFLGSGVLFNIKSTAIKSWAERYPESIGYVGKAIGLCKQLSIIVTPVQNSPDAKKQIARIYGSAKYWINDQLGKLCADADNVIEAKQTLMEAQTALHKATLMEEGPEKTIAIEICNLKIETFQSRFPRETTETILSNLNIVKDVFDLARLYMKYVRNIES